MNKSKVILSAVAAVAAIGGAFALKSAKLAGTQFLYDRNGNGVCTTAAIGYAYSPSELPAGERPQYLVGNATVTIVSKTSKACASKYYQFDL